MDCLSALNSPLSYMSLETPEFYNRAIGITEFIWMLSFLEKRCGYFSSVSLSGRMVNPCFLAKTL